MLREWKYVNPRRYFAIFEHSIDKDTHWVVFEPRRTQATAFQNDIDNGHLICVLDVAPHRPAEFVIFHLPQLLRRDAGHSTAELN